MAASILEKTAVATAGVVAIVTLTLLAASRAFPGAPGADDGPLTFFIADGAQLTGYLPSDRQLAQWAFESWERHASGAFRLKASSESDAVVRLYWAPLDDSTFGEMRPIVVKGRPGAAVFVRADMEALGPDIALRARQDTLWRDTIVYLTCLHELGHAFGLSHTADFPDIMYFFGYGGDIVEYFSRYRRQLKSREDIPSTSGLSDVDVARLRAVQMRR